MGVHRVGQDARSCASNFELTVIHERKPVWDMHAHCAMIQNIFVRKQCRCFIHTPPFDVSPPHRFTKEDPGLYTVPSWKYARRKA